MRFFRASAFPFAIAIALATIVVLVDALLSLQFAVAFMYAFVVVTVVQDFDPQVVAVTSIASALLTIIILHDCVAEGAAALLRSGIFGSPLMSLGDATSAAKCVFEIVRSIDCWNFHTVNERRPSASAIVGFSICHAHRQSSVKALSEEGRMGLAKAFCDEEFCELRVTTSPLNYSA